ncbi:MAG: serine/threonine protein phosphatase [Proteobacteria bacterium]|nr:serine/threonine protein phosphatase [Pseudomonadota bacterium]
MIEFSYDLEVAEQQIAAVIFYLTAVAHIDGEFHVSEKRFIREYVEKLVRIRVESGEGSLGETRRHYHAMFHRAARYIHDLASEAIPRNENVTDFIESKIKLYALEMLDYFDEKGQRQLLNVVEDLIAADGVLHPAELRFRDEVEAMLHATAPEQEELPPVPATTMAFKRQKPRLAKVDSHPLLEEIEQHYSSDPQQLAQQSAADRALAVKAIGILEAQRKRGEGKLVNRHNVGDLSGMKPFLDGHIGVLPPQKGKKYELIVLGDLHGCYSCLKGALMQSDFLRKSMAYLADPDNNPDVRLVFLGDYIDRGFYSIEGILRTILTLFVTMPSRVVMLRGNHEFFLEREGQVFSGVIPAEAILQWLGPQTEEQFRAYRRLFVNMPNMFLFDRTLFVHGGIPRDHTISEKYRDLSSLNEPEIRFEMMWSDPSRVEYVSPDLQSENIRFPFGRAQFHHFMSLVGANTLIRGHERVDEGFREFLTDDMRLVTLFSAGGAESPDLPDDSPYRNVTPMALTITYEDGEYEATPWEIDYLTWSDPQTNGFLTKPTRKWPWQ